MCCTALENYYVLESKREHLESCYLVKKEKIEIDFISWKKKIVNVRDHGLSVNAKRGNIVKRGDH